MTCGGAGAPESRIKNRDWRIDMAEQGPKVILLNVGEHAHDAVQSRQHLRSNARLVGREQHNTNVDELTGRNVVNVAQRDVAIALLFHWSTLLTSTIAAS